MSDKNVQLKDSEGNLLFPKIKTSNIDNDGGFLTSGSLTSYAPLASPVFTGTPTFAATPTGNTTLVNKQYVDSQVSPKAPLASPAFTGTPTCQNPTTGTGIANKQYVDGKVAGMVVYEELT